MRPTKRLSIAMTIGPGAALALASAIAFALSGCPRHPPTPAPVTPDASDAARPSPIVNPEPGPVPSGNAKKCAAACAHADDVCPGSLNACGRVCARAGGADPGLIPCFNAADGCPALRTCDPVARGSASPRPTPVGR